jgi:hypothetical protein
MPIRTDCCCAARSTHGEHIVAAFFTLVVACPGGEPEPPAQQEALACTAAGCEDGVVVTLKVANNSWPAGEYRLAAEFDSERYKCEFKAPDDVPKDATPTRPLSCEPSRCCPTTAFTGNSRTVSGTRLPGAVVASPL